MPLKVAEVHSPSEFHTISTCERLSFESPDNRLLELYFPLPEHLPLPEAREASIAEATTRQIDWHTSDPTSRWIKVVDDAGEVLGASLWQLYTEDPYSGDGDGEEHGCTWFAEGEDRHVADVLMGQFVAPRMGCMRCPHVFLNIFFTSPNSRRLGVGRLMMEWGVALADKHNLPAYIDATDLGRKLYTHYGFKEDEPRSFTFEGLEKTARLAQLGKRLLPFTWWPMYRPVRGEWEGKKAPWDEIGVEVGKMGGDRGVEVDLRTQNPAPTGVEES